MRPLCRVGAEILTRTGCSGEDQDYAAPVEGADERVDEPERCTVAEAEVQDFARPRGPGSPRVGAGYFTGDLARTATAAGMVFPIGATRIESMWKALAGIDDGALRDAIEMENGAVRRLAVQVAGS